MNLVALQFKTTNDFSWNLDYLETLITKAPFNSFIVAPELALNGYAYNRMDDAVEITKKAIELFKKLSVNKTISITMTTKKDSQFFNTLHIFYKGEIVHTQSKIQLFVLNDEKVHFTPGSLSDMKLVDLDGFKVGAIICFELRFISYWQRLRGADLIIVPSMWGQPRKDNFETLTKALAVANQCFVIASDSANDDMAKGSGIITPFGNEYRDDNKEFISKLVDIEEITKMRKYMDVGIK
jgi:predicted amidohydrolase